MKVYLVEDDANIREMVVYALNAGGFAAEGYESAAPFYDALEMEVPALVLLDIMLPGEDGLAILRNLRAQDRTKKLPVMLLTAKNAEYDKVLGLDAGADDYLAKPFGVMELLARVRALLRRAGNETGPEEKFLCNGALAMWPAQRRVTAGGQVVLLTLKEFELLQTLMENEGMVFTRDVLLGGIWGYDYEGETRTVDVHVGSLRQKLGQAGQAIETVRGVGYRLAKSASPQKGTP